MWVNLSRKDAVALKSSRFDNGYIEFKVTAVVPHSEIEGPDTSLADLPSHMFKLWIVDNDVVKDCRNN
jgi:hypothetical protein